MVTLLGAYTHNVDAKGRVSLPAKFRRKLPADLIVALAIEGDCLCVYEEEAYEEYIEEFFRRRKGLGTAEGQTGYDILSADDIEARRQLSERAADVTVDSAGRINLPQGLAAEAGLGKEVVLIGSKGGFEIWDAKRREAARATVDLKTYVKHS